MGLETEWVEDRKLSTVGGLFNKLLETARACVQKRNGQLIDEPFSVFFHDERPGRFCVDAGPPRQSPIPPMNVLGVSFNLREDRVEIRGFNDINVNFNVQVGMNVHAGGFQIKTNTDQATILVDAQLWQVMYRALEPLLFHPDITG